MKLKFESNLEYQLDAIRAVTGLFEGMRPNRGEFDVSRNISDNGDDMEVIDEEDTPMRYMFQCERNPALPDSETILSNLQHVQEENDIVVSSALINPKSPYPQIPNFSVEMETGTGKTYVYLRTIFELNKLYGFRKFIVVVPSVAIREGILSSINLMREHFLSLYDNVPFSHFIYNSKDLSKVRQFAIDNTIQLMIINIQAFQKDDNIIRQVQERMGSHKPIDFIQGTRPVVIVDEPQSVDTTEKSQRAIKLLQPLLILRYSATHIDPYNLLYRLDPIKAYDMRLVKQIEVASIEAEQDFNKTYIRLDKITYQGKSKTPHAVVSIHENRKTGPKLKSVRLNMGTSVAELTNRSGYEGYVVNEICAEDGNEHVSFANGVTLYIGTEQGGNQNELLKAQIRLAVEEHFKKEKRYKPLGIKVLSLFFVDKVANYRQYDESGNPLPGPFAKWFEEAYNEFTQKPAYKGVLAFTAQEVHNGYFSEDKKQFVDTSGGTKKDDSTYHKIMSDKETLLSQDEPLRFIFSHSALKEGWDNPNVFQICTLREMSTTRERRQTLGRGLRLPVDQTGNRVRDDSINRLTVIADEPFEDYVRGLQTDIESECNIKFGCLEKIVFASLKNRITGQKIGQGTSESIWNTLKEKGYINQDGDITEQFTPNQRGFKLELPQIFEFIRTDIQDTIQSYVFSGRIKNSRDKKKLKYNKRVELNEDFQELWNRISPKTRYFVEFDTDNLIKDATKRIKEMPNIHRVRLHLIKHEVDISSAGVDSKRIIDQKHTEIESSPSLPDIISFLQRETGLTRYTLLEILNKSKRIEEFLLNPQVFLTETAKCINKALAAMIVDGIKYERIEGQQYEMRLFEEKEIETYLTRLYEVQSQDKTPYDFVPYDSAKEMNIAELLDSNESVRFFCKLPIWFTVPTPLGTYNPDWALVMENDGKLYLVRETKGTLEQDKRREQENRKIQCGKAHFDALGVDFKDAVEIADVLG